MAVLRWVSGPDPRQIGSVLTLTPGEHSLGRGTQNAFIVSGVEVSRHHAVLHHAPEGWWIEDLDSANGTYLNQQRYLSGRQTHRQGPVHIQLPLRNE